MKITTRRLVLTDITEQDLQVLHSWRNGESFMTLCSVRQNSVSFDEFKKELISDFQIDRFCQMLIKMKRSGQAIGTVYCYKMNKADGHCFVTIYLDAPFRSSGFGAEAFACFGHYLFQDVTELHKIYAEAYEYNEHSWRSLLHAGFSEEGRFKEHRLFESKRYDLLRLAFFRRQIDDTTKKFPRLFRATGEA